VMGGGVWAADGSTDKSPPKNGASKVRVQTLSNSLMGVLIAIYQVYSVRKRVSPG